MEILQNLMTLTNWPEFSQFPSACIYSVSWKACGCYILHFSGEVWFSLSSKPPSRRFRNWLSHQRIISYLLGYTMEGMTQRRKGWVMVTKKSFLSKSACLERLTGIQMTGLGDSIGQGYHTHERTRGFGCQRRWLAVPSIYTWRDSGSWKHSWT